MKNEYPYSAKQLVFMAASLSENASSSFKNRILAANEKREKWS